MKATDIAQRFIRMSFAYWLMDDSCRASAFRNAAMAMAALTIDIDNAQQLAGIQHIGPSATHEVKSYLLFGTSERYDTLMARYTELAKPLDATNGLMSSIDAHTHTTWSDGWAPPSQLVSSAKAQGMELIGIADHWRKETNIADYVDALHNAGALASIEIDVDIDGSLSMPIDDVQKLDYAVVSVHKKTDINLIARYTAAISALQSIGKKMIIAHPSGRKLSTNPHAANPKGKPMTADKPADLTLDWESLFKMTGSGGILLEINSNPNRLDLDPQLIPLAKDHGSKFIVNTDTHYWYQRWLIDNGLATAASAGLQQQDLVATRNQFHDWLNG